MTTATERFKALLLNALERVCILEAELEATRAERDEARAELEEVYKLNGERVG